MLDEFPWSICMRKWKWFSNQTFSRWVCLKTGRREYSFTLGYDKIILHRIISVVWLTNFLSEIRSLSPHDDETQLHVLSVILVLDLESETADDRLQRLQPLQWMWSSLSGLSKKKWIKASLGSHGRNKIILNWYPSHTEIFSKRRKIYAVWVKDLSYDCGAFELVTTLANLAKSLWTTFKVGLGFRELA